MYRSVFISCTHSKIPFFLKKKLQSLMGQHCFFASIFLGFLFTSLIKATLVENDQEALLDFVSKLPPLKPLNWNKAFPACNNWTGIACNEDGTRVISLRLPGIGFHGPIPQNTLGRLSALQVLSLRSNAINGSFPMDFGNFRNLSFLYLQNNDFSGPLPFDFSVWSNLTVVDLSVNMFNGSIPSSISSLSNLQVLNLSNNNLSGLIPDSLKRFPKSVFVGNNLSFSDFSPSISPIVSFPQNPKSKNKLSQKALLSIVIACSVLGLLGFAFLLLVYLLKRKTEDVDVFMDKLEKKGRMSPEKAIFRNEEASNKLVFFEGCSYAFDLEDLLRASAEVLGKGTFGTAYKAILEDSTMVVVKRLKEVGVGRKEFEQQMEVVGRIKHENLIELRAYYYSKDEKLVVCDYFSNGSVCAMLHGKGGEKTVPLDWETRLKIAIGAARGIARIHIENGGRLVHGNVKSSNIFLNPKQYGCVSDMGLSSIMASLAPPIARASGYRAPEVSDTRKATQASDVYSFGVFILELLTAKPPIHTCGDEVISLVRWVHSVVREEWTGEVFDTDLLRYPNIEEELVEVLQIGMACVVRDSDQRPNMAEVVRMLENVRSVLAADDSRWESMASETPRAGGAAFETNSLLW